MKTVTKFLSMLLLVAMCLSLVGGSAFAAGLNIPGGGDMGGGMGGYEPSIPDDYGFDPEPRMDDSYGLSIPGGTETKVLDDSYGIKLPKMGKLGTGDVDKFGYKGVRLFTEDLTDDFKMIFIDSGDVEEFVPGAEIPDIIYMALGMMTEEERAAVLKSGIEGGMKPMGFINDGNTYKIVKSNGVEAGNSDSLKMVISNSASSDTIKVEADANVIETGVSFGGRNLDLNNFTLTIDESVSLSGGKIKGPGTIILNAPITGSAKLVDVTVDMGSASTTFSGNFEMTGVIAAENVLKRSSGRITLVSGSYKDTPRECTAVSVVAGSEVNFDNGTGAYVVEPKANTNKLFTLSSGDSYDDLYEALDYAKSSDTITVGYTTGTIDVGSASSVSPAKNITLNLDGNQIDTGVIAVAGTLTIRGGIFNGTLENKGKLIVAEGSKVGDINSSDSAARVDVNGEAGDIEVTVGGTVNVNGTAGEISLFKGTLNVNGTVGDVDVEAGTLNINKPNANVGDIYILSDKARLEVTGGTIGSIAPQDNAHGIPRSVRGGKWTNDPEKYVADEYESEEGPGGFGVYPKDGGSGGIGGGDDSNIGGITQHNNKYFIGRTNDPISFTAGSTVAVYSISVYGAGGNYTLTQNHDYTVSNGHYIIKPEALTSRFVPQKLTISFNSSNGNVEKFVYVVPASYPTVLSYDKANRNAVSVTFDNGISPYGFVIKDSAGQDYKLTENYHYTVSGNTITLARSFLDTLVSEETYSLCYLLESGYTNNNVENIASFGVPLGINYTPGYDDGYNPIYPESDYMVIPLNTELWRFGDPDLGFRIYPQLDKTPPKFGGIAIDGVPVTDYEKFLDYGDTIYLGAEQLLKTLRPGWHKLTVYFEDAANKTGPSAEINFRIGPSLKAINTDKHVINSNKTLRFECSEPITSVYVGGRRLDPYDDYYRLSNNRKVLTLTAAFLNDRTPSTQPYILSVNDEAASCKFYILSAAQAASSPRTGDDSNIGLWLAFLMVSGGAVAVALPKLKKGKG